MTEADLLDEPVDPLMGEVPSPPTARPVSVDETSIFQAEAVPLGPTLRRVAYQPPPPVKKKKAKSRSTRGAAATMGMWVAGFVFIFVLPPACIVILMAIVSYSKHGMFGTP